MASTRTALSNTSVRTGMQKSQQQQAGGAASSPSGSSNSGGIAELNADLHKFLYQNENQTVANGLEKLEQKTGLKREHAAYGLGGLVALYLLLGAGGAFVCNVLIGVAYPATASLRAVRNQDKGQDAQLLTYWSLFGALLLLDSLLNEVPGYFLLKAAGLLALALPQIRGAEVVYNRAVEPALARLDSLLKKSE